MQTTRHVIFAVLALCLGGCTGRTPSVASPAGAPAVAHAEPAPPPATRVPDIMPQTPPRTGPGAPTIERVRITGPQTVLVHFSEPVTVSDALDPHRFRLSLATAYAEGEGDSVTYYYDPGGMADVEHRTRFSSAVVEDAMTLRLQLEQPLAAEVCDVAKEMVFDLGMGPGASGGLFLHYRDDGAAGIVDADGFRLDDIAAHWVEREALTAGFEGGELRPISAAGPIDCHFTR